MAVLIQLVICRRHYMCNNTTQLSDWTIALTFQLQNNILPGGEVISLHCSKNNVSMQSRFNRIH